MTESSDGAVTHPSGWWKASDGRWYPPDQQPGVEVESPDGAIALAIVAIAFVLAVVLPWTRGNADVTLLLCGTAAAFATRWWVFGRPGQDAI